MSDAPAAAVSPPEEIVVSPTVSPSAPSSSAAADSNTLPTTPASASSNSNDDKTIAASIKAGEKACVDDYSSTPPDNSPPPAVRCKIYFNRLLTPANKREPYPVYQLQLHDVAHFFSPPPALRRSADSAVDVKPGRNLPRRLTSPVAKLLHGIEAVVHPSAKRAAERERQRKVLGASLLTQNFNDKAPRIKATFAKTPQGALARATGRAVHRKMYGKGIFSGPFKRREKSWISTGDELLDVIEKHGGKAVARDSKPANNTSSSSSPAPPPSEHESKSDKKAGETAQRKLVRSPAGPEYTYTLLADGVLHFSRGDTPILNIASKHMMHSSCAPQVVYAGTMRIEAQKTNDDGDDERVRRFLIMDNDSGTYAPRCDRAELRRLRDLMQWNFPGLIVLARKYVPAGMEKELGDDNGTDGCGGGIVEAEESERAAKEAGTTSNRHEAGSAREAPGGDDNTTGVANEGGP
ncbi:hypothetical protein HDU87_004422 [Geranomyces variabilis]|uniref:Uncharacterized protein n=1 Tax=Geranomyces variabilis TaxID=109894 RepID=A0AAD5XRW4_9FUNG|nr:hypothetical protein HDU87_004422 [Geranomyces variabilis]